MVLPWIRRDDFKNFQQLKLPEKAENLEVVLLWQWFIDQLLDMLSE